MFLISFLLSHLQHAYPCLRIQSCLLLHTYIPFLFPFLPLMPFFFSLSLSLSLSSNMDLTRIISTISFPYFPSPSSLSPPMCFFDFDFPPTRLFCLFVCLSSVKKHTPRLCSSIIPFHIQPRKLDHLPPLALRSTNLCLSSPVSNAICVAVCRTFFRPPVCSRSSTYSYLLTLLLLLRLRYLPSAYCPLPPLTWANCHLDGLLCNLIT